MRGAGGQRRLRLVRQLEVGDCGAACLAVVLRGLGHPAELSALRDLTSTGREGVTAAGLVAAARHFGVTMTGVRWPVDRLAELPPGSILHWAGNHFVVLERHTRNGAVILDPAVGRRAVTAGALAASYSGVALVVAAGAATPDTGTTIAPNRRAGRLAPYRPFIRGSGLPALLAALCAVVVQVFVLANPLVLRRVVEALTDGEVGSTPTTLAVGVGALAVGYLGAVLGRLAFLVALQRGVDFRLTLGILEHLVTQPYAYLARRSSGDLALRLRSTVVVRQVLTSGALSALLDGALVLLYLGLIVAVDVWFGLLTAGAVLAQAIVVGWAWPRLRSASAEALEAQTASQAQLLEIIGGLELLKASGTAGQVVDGWSGRLRVEVDAQARRSRLGGVVDAVLLALRFTAPPLLLALGLSRVSSGDLALADMLALAALSAAVTVPTGSLLSTVCSLSTVGSYLERLDDLLHAEPERPGGLPAPEQLAGEVELQDVSFRYSALLPPAVQDVSLVLEPGEHVAVIGASGSGKTTLAMLVATLHQPADGAVLIDGVDTRDYDIVDLRRHIGIVTQDTRLFAQTVRDNICLGRPGLTDDQVAAAAALAHIHDDILALPAGYATVLGDGGTGLSGGQRQRLALARALVASPGLLILDEATSALDAPTEEAVHRSLRTLPCTALVVAHRMSTVAHADRVVVLEHGRLVASGTHAALRRTSPAYRALVGIDAGPPSGRRSAARSPRPPGTAASRSGRLR